MDPDPFPPPAPEEPVPYPGPDVPPVPEDLDPAYEAGYEEPWAEQEQEQEQEQEPEPEPAPGPEPPLSTSTELAIPEDPSAPFWYHQPSEPGERAKQFYAWVRKTWTASTTPHAESGEPAEVAYRTHQILVFAAGTGVIVGLVVVLLKKATLDWLADPMVNQPIWLRAAGPAIGLIVAWAALAALAHKASPATTDEYVRSFHTSPHVPLDHSPVLGRTVASVGTIGYGGALSPEGPAIYLGAVIGSTLQQRFARFFSREDAKALMVAGAAAGVAAIFKAPATGALFAVELPYQTDVARRVGLPAMIGAVTGYVTAALIDGTAPLFPIGGSTFDGKDLVGALIVGVVCGIGARGFSLGLAQLQRYVSATPLVWRMIGAGVALFALAYAADAAFDRPLSLGAGYDVIAWAVSPAVSLWLVGLMLGIRVAATMVTWGGGGAGGFFLPLAVSGALIGRLLGGAMGFADTELLLVVGMAAFLGAGYRTPLAAVLFVAETTGRAGFVVPALVATAAAQLIVGRTSVSPAQRAGRLGHLERRNDMPISAVLETDVRTVPPDATVEELLAVHLVANRRRAVPVVGDDSRFLGLAVLDEVVHVRRDAWPTTSVETIAQADAPRGRTTWLVRDALAAMESAGTDLLPIVDGHDRFVGIVTTDDILELDAILDRTAKAR
ncbi:MAG TPA: chloride channel protein [Acidimicrobiales bacterium]|nr:chloride channel protein [Acidimicrobiales bacterium]